MLYYNTKLSENYDVFMTNFLFDNLYYFIYYKQCVGVYYG